jgi:hypothetical protein
LRFFVFRHGYQRRIFFFVKLKRLVCLYFELQPRRISFFFFF